MKKKSLWIYIFGITIIIIGLIKLDTLISMVYYGVHVEF